METPLRGISPRELCKAKFSPPVCSGSRRMSNTGVPLRTAECFCRAHLLTMCGVSKGACPFSWRSRNQEVPCVLFVKLSSHKKVSAGVGRVGPQRFRRMFGEGNFVSFSCPHHLKCDFAESLCAGLGRVGPQIGFSATTLRAYSARARGSFLLEKKGTKDSPKRRFPLWILL